MNWENLGQNVLIWAALFGVKILGALLLWIAGRMLIRFAVSLLKRRSTSSDNEGTASAKQTSNRNAKFIGGGAGGAVIGALAGGGKGAAIGAGVGAGVGFLAKKLMKGKEAEVKSGTEFGVILNRPISLPAYCPTR